MEQEELLIGGQGSDWADSRQKILMTGTWFRQRARSWGLGLMFFNAGLIEICQFRQCCL
jgi:hypothetical protein